MIVLRCNMIKKSPREMGDCLESQGVQIEWVRLSRFRWRQGRKIYLSPLKSPLIVSVSAVLSFFWLLCNAWWCVLRACDGCAILLIMLPEWCITQPRARLDISEALQHLPALTSTVAHLPNLKIWMSTSNDGLRIMSSGLRKLLFL